MANEVWQAPLFLLPGVALLILSTQARFGQLHQEIHHLLGTSKLNEKKAQSLLSRALMFRTALVELYLSVALFASGSLLGGIVYLLAEHADWVVMGFTCLGILTLLLASYQLVRESRLAHQMILFHMAEFEGHRDQEA